ncbi:MAG: 1-phosphofructokinase [Acutalibacteraceae bacterium]|nr:1-phosphofructokinase [Acutalibacteraceae bacterium]
MIYTLTLNPSIDYVVHLPSFIGGITNRTTGEEYYIGGKGINVSCILAELGLESTALGFTAGFTGEAIEQGLAEQGIHADFIRLPEGISRINIKVKADQESEINGQGPHITSEAFERLLQKTDAIQDGDTIVLAGSIPKTVSDDAYEKILERLKDRDIRIVVDATKQLLLNCLKYRPFLIKPNRQELSEIFRTEVSSEEETAVCARQLQEQGARNVIVSLGGEGAVLFAENGQTYHTGVVKDTVLSTVGSGDSMVAGFIAGYAQTGDYGYALKLGTACGNATAFSKGLATKEKIQEVFGKL